VISFIREREIIEGAVQAVRDNGFKSLPVDPRQIAKASKIELMPWKPDKLGVSGFLMRVGEDFGLGYSTAIENEGFINFTIAHELGHYFLSGHVEALIGYSDGIHYSASGFISNDLHEREADAFACRVTDAATILQSRVGTGGHGLQRYPVSSECGPHFDCGYCNPLCKAGG
jgi:hypothetical protein